MHSVGQQCIYVYAVVLRRFTQPSLVAILLKVSSPIRVYKQIVSMKLLLLTMLWDIRHDDSI